MNNENSGLKILITNAFIENWSGSELYIRDVAVELIQRGHKPFVFSPRLGTLALDFRTRSIPVVEELGSFETEPDLIHGQHHLETMIALSRFPFTPVVYFCHGWLPWEERVPVHPHILHYVTVSDALRDRLVFEYSIPAEKITTIYNFVDLEKFHLRSPLPATPKRALVFNNQASESNYLSIIRNACAVKGIILDVIGYQAGNPSFYPELQLGNYDIIFARGRAALESLATGAAVICCGVEGTGQMITRKNLDWMRCNNFGIRVMTRPITYEIISAELQRYDVQDALQVTEEVRAVAGVPQAVNQILAVYQIVLDKWAEQGPFDLAENARAYSNYLQGLANDFNEATLERRSAYAIGKQLQAELDDIHNRTFWKVYTRLARIPWLRRLYLSLVTSIRRRRAGRNKSR